MTFNYISHTVGYLFIFFIVSLEAQFLILMMSILSIFSFIALYLEIHCQIQGYEDVPLYFLLSFIV